MRYLVLSDIHANLQALDAVLAAVTRRDVDRVLLLGDVVGYGANPNGVIERVIALAPDALIRGNHDKVAAGVEPPDTFNAAARYAAMWTLAHLTPAHRDWLASLPRGPVVVDQMELCHGSPGDEDEYIFEPATAEEALRAARAPLCFFGHTHVQVGYRLSAGSLGMILPEADAATEVVLEPGLRYLINPGSVGQPRDGDPRAGYAVYDSEAGVVRLHRVGYDIAGAQADILAAGLPEALAHRLAIGR